MARRPTASRSRRRAQARPAGGSQRVRELSWSELDGLAQQLAAAVQKAYDPDAVVGVVKGGVFAGAAVAEALGRKFFAVRISRRSRDRGLLPRPKIWGRMPPAVRGRRVLVVDDVAASGETLRLARRLATAAGARTVRTASIAVHKKGFRPDFYALASDDLIVFPWDYHELDSQRFRAVGGV